MKRPPGLWLLLSAGVLWLSLQNVYALKATELIFGKTTTTTTTTEIAPEGEQKDGVSPENSEENENSIKSNLTGNPQLDYIFDPNLPRELNGYNLSSYPFYNSMPEDIDFKCDGLHDGFYASVPHKCQVYHHCLFGTRYDFLCANYTAFDQKTFICHFVSEVDCNNSHKYWHRNDALYQAATTTTTKAPPIVISPALTASARRPSPAVRRPKPSRRRPQYDYYDEEYDEDDREDYYEEPPPRRRRKRPRPHRRRPIYEDDYEDYEDDRYERRGSGRRNGDDDRKSSYDRREPDDRHNGESVKKEHDSRNDGRESEERHGADDDKRPSDRKQLDDRRNRDDDRDYDRREIEERRNREDDRRPYDRKESDDRLNREDERYDRKPYDRRESGEDNRKQHDRRDYDDRRYDDRSSEGKRYKEDRRRDHDDRVRYEKDDDVRYDRDRERRKENDRRRRPDDDYRDEHDDRRPQDKRSGGDRRYEKRRPTDDQDSYDRPRKGHRRPYDDDLYDDDRDDDRRGYNRPRKNDSKGDVQPQDNKRSPENDGTLLVKPSSSSSVFNQPRMPPRIRPPVPKNEQNKFAYKTMTEKPATKKPQQDEEYYDYEDEPIPKRSTQRPNRKPDPEPSETRRPSKPNSERDEKRENRRPSGSASRPRIHMSRKPVVEPADEYEEEKPRSRLHNRPRHDLDNRDSKTGLNSRNRPPVEDDFLEPESEDERSTSPKPSQNSNKERNMPKFIQRGRNEFRDRTKSEPVTPTTTTTTTSSTTTTTTKEPPRERHEPVVKVVKRPFLPSRGGNPYTARGLQPVGAKALESSRNSSPTPQEPNIATKSINYNDNDEFESPKPVSKYNSETTKSTNYNEPRQNYKLVSESVTNNEEPLSNYKIPTTEDYSTVQNGRRFPTSTEQKSNTFIINEQPVENYKRRPSLPNVSTKEPYETPYRTTEINEPPPPEEKPFKPSPILIKVPVRLKYSNPINNGDDEEFRPVSNRPQSALRPNKNRNYEDPRTTEKAVIPERNPLDINENEYDVTLNDALNPTIPNLPIRNFPASFTADTGYTYSSFQRPRYDVSLNQASENRYQVRAPSQRVETVQPYINEDGKKYINSNAQYNLAADQIYQNQNFRSNPQITQAQTHAYYSAF